MSTYKLEVLLGVNLGAFVFATLLMCWPDSRLLGLLIVLSIGFNIGAFCRELQERSRP